MTRLVSLKLNTMCNQAMHYCGTKNVLSDKYNTFTLWSSGSLSKLCRYFILFNLKKFPPIQFLTSFNAISFIAECLTFTTIFIESPNIKVIALREIKIFQINVSFYMLFHFTDPFSALTSFEMEHLLEALFL